MSSLKFPTALAVMLAFAGAKFVSGAIIIDGVTSGVGLGGSGNRTILSGFDASGSDKLVVVLGGEHGFGGNIGGQFNSVTYNGTPLTLAVQEEAGIPTAAIFYLDDPGAAGDVIVNQANHNNSPFAVYLLSGTDTGIGLTAKDTDNSIDLLGAGVDSLIISGMLNAGPSGGNGAPNMTPTNMTEDTPDLTGGGSRRWTSFSAAHATGPGVFSFSGSSNPLDALAIVGVEFTAAAVPEPASLALWGLLGFGLISIRRYFRKQ